MTRYTNDNNHVKLCTSKNDKKRNRSSTLSTDTMLVKRINKANLFDCLADFENLSFDSEVKETPRVSVIPEPSTSKDETFFVLMETILENLSEDIQTLRNNSIPTTLV